MIQVPVFRGADAFIPGQKFTRSRLLMFRHSANILHITLIVHGYFHICMTRCSAP